MAESNPAWRDEFRFTMKPQRGRAAQGWHNPCGRFFNGLKVMENHAKHTCRTRPEAAADPWRRTTS